jgi:hypothetical protein
MEKSQNEWQHVSRKKSSNRKNNSKSYSQKFSHKYQNAMISDHQDACDCHVSREELITNIDRNISEVSRSKFYGYFLEKLNSFQKLEYFQMYFLGIGSFSTSPASCLQMSFGICISREYKVNNLYIYDPVMSMLEKDICQRYGITVLSENMNGRYFADSNSLFYMPHCPYNLYNNLIWANWCTGFENITIIGNRYL